MLTLHALKKKLCQVIYNLIFKFYTFGAPNILQFNNSCEFIYYIICQLKNMWPKLKILHWKQRHCQSQVNNEMVNRDI